MSKDTHPLTDFRRAFGLSQGDLANKVGVLAPAISKWEKRKGPNFVPADKVVAVSSVTGIPRHRLRPDLYLGHVNDC